MMKYRRDQDKGHEKRIIVQGKPKLDNRKGREREWKRRMGAVNEFEQQLGVTESKTRCQKLVLIMVRAQDKEKT